MVLRLIIGIHNLFLYWNSDMYLTAILLSEKMENTNSRGNLNLPPWYLGLSK